EEPARHGRRKRWDAVLRGAEPRPNDLQSPLRQRLHGPVRCRRQPAVSGDPRRAPTIPRRHHRRRLVPVPDPVRGSEAVTRHTTIGVRRRVGGFNSYEQPWTISLSDDAVAPAAGDLTTAP